MTLNQILRDLQEVEKAREENGLLGFKQEVTIPPEIIAENNAGREDYNE